MQGSILRCWQLSPLSCPCTEFVLFFKRFVRCWAWDRPRPHPWAFLGFSSYVLGNRAPRPGLWALNVKWARTSNFLAPQYIFSIFCYINFLLLFLKLKKKKKKFLLSCQKFYNLTNNSNGKIQVLNSRHPNYRSNYTHKRQICCF